MSLAHVKCERYGKKMGNISAKTAETHILHDVAVYKHLMLEQAFFGMEAVSYMLQWMDQFEPYM